MPERVKKLTDFFGVPRREDFSSLGEFLKSPTTNWLLILAFATVVTLIATFSWQRIPKYIEEGTIATHDIKADRNYEILDEETTNKLKSEAAESVLPVYNFDEGVSKAVITRIHSAFAAVREENPAAKQANPDEILKTFSTALGIESQSFTILLKENFSFRVEQMLSGIISSKLSQPIIAEKGTLAAERERGIILRHIRPEGETIEIVGEKTISDPTQIPTTADVREKITKMGIAREHFRTKEAAGAVIAMAQLLVEPTVSFDNIETDKRREQAIVNVQDVLFRVKAGEIIIRNGERFDARHIKILNGIRKETGRSMYALEFLGTLIFVILSLIVIFYFAEKYIRRFHPSRRDYFLMGILALIHVLVIRLGFTLVLAIHSSLLYDISTSALYYTIPVAGTAMLLRMFLRAEDSFFFAIFASLLVGLFSEADLSFVVFCFVSNIAGIAAIANADKRSTIIKAGLATGIVGAIAIMGIKLVLLATGAGQVGSPDIFWHMFSAFVGGISSAIFVMVMALLIESVMDYTTDIKLLELANLNHPILRELIVRSPGTYHHSHLVGILAEAAAEAIGANPLLVRVGAYYHDIGKIKKPLYFVENTKDGEDRHAKLLPHMSALIISSHVKDGMEMAQETKLPRSIVDMIPQHHGTRAISFFYEKAKGQKTGDEVINEEDFRYPGPKPQTREAAILMLADVAEAAVRSLKEKSTARIQQTVQRVINDCFAEEQLDECELTLRDLNEIAKSFAHILFGIYHQRIEYPKESKPEPEVNVVDKEKMIENQSSKSPPKQTGQHRGRPKSN